MRRFLAAAMVAILAGCATPYGEMGVFGGVTATRIDEHRLSILAKGNGFTGLSTMRNYVLRKAAEETLKDGFTTFEVVDAHGRMHNASFTTGGSLNTTYTASGAYSFYAPPQTIHVEKPTMEADIVMSKAPKTDPMRPNTYFAEDVLKYMAPVDPKTVAGASAPRN